MSGFIRKSIIKNELLTSGIPSLDKIIRFERKLVNCIFEDENSFIHNTFLQIFISSNLNQTFVFSNEQKNFIFFDRSEDTDKYANDNLSIAWRYKNLENQRSTQFNLDLMKKNVLQDNIFDDFEQFLDLLKLTKNGNFVIFSFLSPLFLQKLGGSFDAKYSIIQNMLFDIRKYAKLNNNFVYISCPVFLNDSLPMNYFDNVISIKSILNLPHENSIYNCFIEILKSNDFGMLKVNDLESIKYGLILKSKKVLIENIDIPPDESAPKHASCSKTF